MQIHKINIPCLNLHHCKSLFPSPNYSELFSDGGIEDSVRCGVRICSHLRHRISRRRSRPAFGSGASTYQRRLVFNFIIHFVIAFCIFRICNCLLCSIKCPWKDLDLLLQNYSSMVAVQVVAHSSLTRLANNMGEPEILVL